MEKVFSYKSRHALANIILAVGNNSRMWYRDPQRMPEQSNHREPIGQRPHHTCFSEGI